ncbi:MAG: PQQ-dependent sugar dehydrogenase [Chloroflexi bacterium]|nr:PQQ-dependent sugar dehydrogenase [Chloroflexota bacterium]
MFTGIFTKLYRPSVVIISVALVVEMMIGTHPVSAQTSPLPKTESTTNASIDPAKISFQEVATGLASPVIITNAGDGSGRIFFVEQAGTIRILKNGTLLGTPFLDIHTIVKSGGEQGLLALAFHPSYSTNGLFFVAYTAPRAGDSTGSNLILERFSVSANNPDLANPNSGVILLTISHPVNSNHNGGTLAFGADGYLYWSTGDGGSGGDPPNNAQQLNNLLGKLLRIDVNSGSPYGIPTSNPFYSNPDPNVKKEIWAYGLRNPWRISFDKLTHDLYIGDVGQSAREEVDFQPASSAGGENYGWRVMEGSICYDPASGCDQSGKVLPVAEYNHTLGCSITGGNVYRGSNFPSLSGFYFYGDFCSGRFFSLYNDATLGWTSTQLLDTAYTISTFGEDEQGELYLADYGAGKIYNIRYQEAPIVISSVRAHSNPTGAANVNFTVTFSQTVTGVDTGDFTLTTSGVSGPAVSGLSGSGSVYTVTVNTGSGSGSIKLNVADNDSIVNGFGTPLGGSGAGNGNFTSGETYTITKTWIFGDVPDTYWSWSYIERLYNAGITAGCSTIPLNYCPTTVVTREQMAVFLLRGIHGSGYTPPAATGTRFNDVPLSYPNAAFIEQLAAEGITSGCGGGNYCPGASVTRAQMAIFLVRAMYGIAFVPPTATGVFTDVPVGSFGADFIEQLAADSITSGCGAGIYCPSTTVKRDSMAVFLVRTFNLP